MSRPNIPSVLCLCLPALLGVAIMLRRGAPDARWHDLGPLRLHASALLMPVLLVFAAGELPRRPWASHLLLLGAQVVHWLQPDAGQATAVACGAIALVCASPHQPNKALLSCMYAISGALTWFRTDDLPPASFVEDILAQAFALTPALGVLALLSLALFVLAPVLSDRSKHFPLSAVAALVGYFVGSLMAPCFGEFPVPLLGFGTSPTLGAFLGLALLRRLQLAAPETRALASARRPASKDAERNPPHKLQPSTIHLGGWRQDTRARRVGA